MSDQIPLLDVDPSARRDEDFYATPAFQTRALLARCPLGGLSGWGGRIVEPCCGDGAIVRELSGDFDLLTNDVVAREPFVPDFLLDATQAKTWDAFRRVDKLDAVITNPPFDQAFDIVRHALDAVEIGLAILLRLSWLEPTDERGEWLSEHPPTRQIVLPRHDYRGNGKTDSVTSAWLLWAKRDWFCDPGIEIVTKAECDALAGGTRKRKR